MRFGLAELAQDWSTYLITRGWYEPDSENLDKQIAKAQTIAAHETRKAGYRVSG